MCMIHKRRTKGALRQERVNISNSNVNLAVQIELFDNCLNILLELLGT